MKRKLTATTLLLLCGCCIGFAKGDVNFNAMSSKRIESNPDVKWTQFGPGGAGNNYYIYAHPTDPNTLFQGPNMGNSYRTTDKGDTYEGILDWDGVTGRSAERGPVLISPTEFSHQDPNFGMCSAEKCPGLYITYDKGATWHLDHKSLDMFSAKKNNINAIEVDPNDENIWYVGSGNVKDANHFFFSNKYPNGFVGAKLIPYYRETDKNFVESKIDLAESGVATIWKSTNKGKSWSVVTPKGINKQAQITEIYVHPAKSSRVFAATTYGLYVSDDAGKSWTLKNKRGLDNDIIRSIDMHYDKSTKKLTLFAIDVVKYIPDGKSVTYNGGIFRSDDEGESWVNINNDLAVGGALMNNKTVKNSYFKLAISNWFDIKQADAIKRYPEMPKEILHSFSMIKVNPSDVNKLILVNNYKSQYTFPGGMLWKSDDGGKHWVAALRNGLAWEGSDKAYWEARNNPTNKNITLRAQRDWEGRDSYDRKAGATITYNSDGSLLMFQFAKVVCVSTDNGDNWVENDEKDASDDDSGYWVGAGNSNMPGAEIVQDIRLKDKFYLCAGENSIWESSMDGEKKFGIDRTSVKKLTMPNEEKPMECSVSSMAIDPRDPNVLYCVHTRQTYLGKLLKSIDGGRNWSVHSTLFTPPKNHTQCNLFQNHLTIDPNYPDRIYVLMPEKTVDVLAGQGSNKFFKGKFGFYASMDGGATFNKINDGLPNYDVQMLAVSPTEKGVVYCAVMQKGKVAGGLYRLGNGATTWKKVKTPNNMVSVHDIYFAQDGKMYITGGTPSGEVQDGGVWYTTDMKRWKQVFPYQYANHIRVAKYDPNVLLVSIPGAANIMNSGTFRSLNGGKSWEKINFGNIQSDRLNDIQIDYFRPGIYWCSTYGAGYYKGVDHSIVSER